jgi:cation diffusion facilitator family transporter
MNSKEFALALDNEENFENSFDFDELFDKLEERLQEQLDFEMLEFDFLKKEQEKIGSPEALGETIKGVILEQINNQIATVAGEDFIKENGGLTLDLRDEAHIQDPEKFRNSEFALHNTEINYKDRYEKWKKNFKLNEDKRILTDESGKEVLLDGYRSSFDKKRDTGTREIHKDHTIPVAEFIRDPEVAMYNISKEEIIKFANSNDNLKDLSASINLSKKDKSVQEFVKGMSENERKNPVIEKLENDDKNAREKYKNEVKEKYKEKDIKLAKKSQRAETFRIGGKALRTVILTLLAELIKKVISKLVKWFKFAEKSFKTLVDGIKEAVSSFFSNIKTYLVDAGNIAVSTILTSMFGPIYRVFQKFWVVLKQGWNSLKEAFDYIRNPKNREKPFDILLLEVGKIVIAGLSVIGSLTLSEVIEKGLMSIPVLTIEIPLIGSLSNIIGIFLGASISGVIGAVAINFIQKTIEKKMKNEALSKQIDKGNQVLITQYKIQKLNEEKLIYQKGQVASNIINRHEKLSKYNAEIERETEEKNKVYKEELEEYKKNAEKNLEKYIAENIIISSEEEIKNQEKIEKNFDEINSLLNSLID